MLGKLIGIVARFTGVAKVWSLLDGYKTYGAAAIAILTGLLGLGNELAPILSAHDVAKLFEWFKHLATCQSWLEIIGGFGLLGLGHKAEKAAEIAAIQVAGTTPPPSVPQ